MTDWTPQNNRIQTMHLTSDELAALKAAKWGWLVSHEFRPDDWRDVKAPNWTSVRIYRAKPAPVTQDVVPWDTPVEFDDTINTLGWKMHGWLLDNGAKFDGRVFNNMKPFIVSLIEDWLKAQQRPQPAAAVNCENRTALVSSTITTKEPTTNFKQPQSRAQTRYCGLSVSVLDPNMHRVENIKIIEAEYNGAVLFSVGVDGLVTHGPAWTTDDQASQAFVNMIGLKLAQFLAPFVAAEIVERNVAIECEARHD